MKLNWGQSITIVIILFMLFILTLVYKMHFRNADLVRDDFYEQEILFDQKKISIANYKALSYTLKISQTPEGVVLEFPKDFEFKKGKVIFYRATDKMLDKEYDLSLDANKKMTLPYTDFIIGNYDLFINWDDTYKKYLFESGISF